MVPPDSNQPNRPGKLATGDFPAMNPAELRAAFFRTFPSVALAIVIAAADQTIVATALPAIAADFHALEQIAWVVVGYLIAGTVAAPVFGRLADAFGRRQLLLVALAVEAAGALLAATSPNFAWLVLARLVQGCGGGGLATMTMALIGEAIPPRERGRFQAYLVACFVTASSLGPVLGGWLTEHFGWRAVFGAVLPAVALAFLLALRLPRRPQPEGRGSFSFDWLGVLLFAGCVAPALLALAQAQRLAVAALPLGLGLAAVAALALVLLLRQERRAPHPLLPLKLLYEPTIWRTNLMTALANGALVSLVSYLPIYLVTVRGLAPAAIGTLLLPLSLGGGLGGLVAGYLISRTGVAMLLPSIGLPIAAGLLALIALAAPALGTGVLAALFGLVGVGIATSYPVVQITVQVAAGPARLGAAAASVQFFRNLGAAICTALLAAVLFGTLAAGDPLVADRFGRLVREGAGLLAELAPPERLALAAGLEGAFRAAFLAVAAMLAAAAVMAWRVPMRRL